MSFISNPFRFNFNSGANLTAFQCDFGNVDSQTACSSTTSQFDKYHNGAALLPEIGNTIYLDPTGISKMNGFNKWYKATSGIQSKAILIDLNGLVTDEVVCMI